jgi:wyosine [tRNA(Phe)-imidazoG37] synthetase (radical SAM superfamily)
MRDATPHPDVPAVSERIVYGPVRSRRLGSSLGLNLLPARSKLCSFNCPYCECGFNTPRAADARWPSPDEVAHALRRALERRGREPDWITSAGNGEPTLHPRFAVAVDRVIAVRDELAPGTRLAVLTNGLAAASGAVAAALRRVDARMIKLDPGPRERVNGATYDVEAVIDACRVLAPVVVQAMVARGGGWDGSSDESLAAWLPLVQRAAPAAVHLYSLERAPADPTVRNVPRERLTSMAEAIRRALPRSEVLVF